jgi:uncharacterized protein YfeS
MATAFGQLKITGGVDDDVLALGIAACAREAIWIEHARAADPDWKEHAVYAARANVEKAKVLRALSSS